MFNLTYKQQKTFIMISFLLVPLALLSIFGLYPALVLIRLSFTDWNGYLPSYDWVGWENYAKVFGNRDIFEAFSHNAVYFLWGFVQNLFALFFAVILNTRIRGRNFYRVLFFMPFILNGVATAFMFQFVYNSQIGSLNTMLSALGIFGDVKISWLGRPEFVNHSLAFIGFWKGFGFNIVLYLAALQTLSSDMIEAARIDGAGRGQLFFRITLPNIMKVIELNLFLTIIGALEVFDLPFILTTGGPNGASETFVTYTVATAFEFSNFGLASAMAVVLIFIVASVLGLQRLVLRRWDQ